MTRAPAQPCSPESTGGSLAHTRGHRQFPAIRLRVALVSIIALAAPVQAVPRAIVVVGLAAGETQAARLQAHAATLREGFRARGLTGDAITVLGGSGERVRRETILAALKSPAAGDETWLVLLGSASDRGGEPNFQVSGPRLKATELAAAVKAMPGRKRVVVATTASGGFLPPLLALPEVEAVAATADSGEVNEPRFAGAWAEALVASPQATFTELAAAAAARVEAIYQADSLAQGEHARLIDRAAGKIIEAPFATSAEPTASAKAGVAAPTAGVSVAEIEIPKPAGEIEIERRPATEESRALLAEARAAAKDDAHAAIYLRTDTEITVGRDFSVIERHRTRAYLRGGGALDELGTLVLPSHPPDFTTRLDGARVITPDGGQVLVNPRSLDARRAEDASTKDRPGGAAAPPILPLPEVAAGCVVEAAWTVERRASGELPEFSQEWMLAGPYPVRALHLSVTVPAEARWRVFAPNLPAAVVTETGGGRQSSWTLTDLPAFEPRAGDPPARQVAAWVGVSSLASWEAFAAWYRRIATGSEQAGPAVAALAAEISMAHADRAGRLRAAYERVAALRYIAVELGVGAFRPRTPEQVWTQRYGDCKDKAGLLVAVLGQLGIPAEFALVNRFDRTFTEWPAWQFNHAVARVPAAPDAGQPQDLWLDTTDRLVPFGIVAAGDLGRQSLAFNGRGAAAFHEITAAQEPPGEWHEDFNFTREAPAWTLKLRAKGPAEVVLRRWFAEMPSSDRAERLQALLAWRGGPVKRVTTGDPYDLGSPFEVEIELAGTAEALGANRPRCLVPGLEYFRARFDGRTQALWWDEGRTWMISRGPTGAAESFQIPGFTPTSAAGQAPRFLMIP